MEWIILLFFMLMLFLVYAIFRYQNTRLRRKYEFQNRIFQEEIRKNNDQINKRKVHLKSYNFLIFNLSEVLIKQKSLNLRTN